MSASQVMLIAFVLLIIAHWANNQPAVSGKTLIEMAAAILIVAMLDHGASEPVAAGLAWLFLAAVLLSNNSPINALKKLGTSTSPAPASKPVIV